MDMSKFLEMCEKKLSEAESADLNHAPMGMTSEEAFAWLSGRASVLQWVLEMLPNDEK